MAVLEAPVGLMEGQRCPLRVGHVQVTLRDLLILTWHVREAAIRSSLPKGIVPVLHNGQALVSALLFHNHALRPAIFGIPRLRCPQLNLRTYIRDPFSNEPGSVFFHGFYLNPAWFAWISSRVFKIPCGSLPLHLRTTLGDRGLVSWVAASRDNSVAIRARECPSSRKVDSDLLDLLTNVHTGYAPDQEPGLLRTWRIWHRNQRLRTMDVDQVRIEPLDRLNLGLTKPDLAFYVEAVDYEVYFPARAVSLDDIKRD